MGFFGTLSTIAGAGIGLVTGGPAGAVAGATAAQSIAGAISGSGGSAGGFPWSESQVGQMMGLASASDIDLLKSVYYQAKNKTYRGAHDVWYDATGGSNRHIDTQTEQRLQDTVALLCGKYLSTAPSPAVVSSMPATNQSIPAPGAPVQTVGAPQSGQLPATAAPAGGIPWVLIAAGAAAILFVRKR